MYLYFDSWSHPSPSSNVDFGATESAMVEARRVEACDGDGHRSGVSFHCGELAGRIDGKAKIGNPNAQKYESVERRDATGQGDIANAVREWLRKHDI